MNLSCAQCTPLFLAATMILAGLDAATLPGCTAEAASDKGIYHRSDGGGDTTLSSVKDKRKDATEKEDSADLAQDANTDQDASAATGGNETGGGSHSSDASGLDSQLTDGSESDVQSQSPVAAKFVRLDFKCKLINNRHNGEPTDNNTHYRANLSATDLGISVKHNNDLYIMFGDTAGAQTIWPLGPESLPDAVGYSAVGYEATVRDPRVLCSELRFLLSGYQTGSVEGDFAATHMTPPPGEPISKYIHNPAGPRGQNRFPNLPGDFEVPSGVFSYNGSIYVFYTTAHLDLFEMKGSYLAKWAAPSRHGRPNYQILYQVDQRFDGNGQLRGRFINISAVVKEPYVYLYGTGKYRASPIYLARKKLYEIEQPGGYELYDANLSTWIGPRDTAAPVMPSLGGAGETSVMYFKEIDRFVQMAQEGSSIVIRFSKTPEGPWTSPQTIASMDDPIFKAKYCCIHDDCSGSRIIKCRNAGFYGSYMLPQVIKNADGTFDIAFTMSTWKPYNVVLMSVRMRF